MEGSEDDLSEDNAGHNTAFGPKYENSEPEGEFLLGRRSYRGSPQRSEKSNRSSRSREAGLDDDASFEDRTVTTQASLRSNSKRSIKREESMTSHHHRGTGRFEGNGLDEYDIDRGSEGDESHRGHVSSSEEEVTDEEAREETVIETSCDEMSFNTSIFSYKETGSSSELSVDPVVWKKFKFLSSILKETQHNLRAMDDLILEHHRLQTQPTALPQPSHTLHQGLGEGEPKTDEAKLEEILSLLHHLTHTLSSYEQHPLLASTPHLQVMSTSLHPDAAAHQQASVALCHPSPTEIQAPTGHTLQPHPHLPSNQPLSPSKDAKFSEICEGKNVSFTTSEIYGTGVLAREDGAYNGISPSFHAGSDSTPSDSRFLQEPHQGAPRDTYSHASPYYSSIKRNVDHVSSLPGISEPHRAHKKDTVSQTDPFLLVPRVGEEYPSPSNSFSCQVYQPESLHGQQEVPHHPLMKETRSLRKDIDDIMARKQALDSRLQSFIAHRAMQRELEATDFDEPRRRLTPLTKSKSLEDAELRRSKSKHRKYKSRSKSYEEESHIKRKSSPRETYLSMINENQDEFPSLTAESVDNEDKITDLQTDEADMPGLGDSGLSSEINSINATIQELVRENQQLHKFLQGMTCESILKVDQEKLALEARLQSLNQENQSLKISLDEEQESAHSRMKGSKGVKFCISEESEEAEDSVGERGETKRTKPKDGDECDSTSKVLTVSIKTEGTAQRTVESGSEPLDTAREGEEEASRFSAHQADATSYLRTEIERLTKQNQQLVNIIEKERSTGSDHRDSSRTLKSQSTDEEVGISSVSESLTDHSSTMREVKLQQKIKKLAEEKEILEFKLSREASERDFESTRLEARIQILSDQNQTLMQKLEGSGSLSNTKKAETSCQTNTLALKSETLMSECAAERQREAHSSIEEIKVCTTATGQTGTAQHTYSWPDRVMPTSTSKLSPPPSASITLSSITLRRPEEYPDTGSRKHHVPPVSEDLHSSRPHLKDLPLSMLSSDENISTDDDKISLIKTPREDTHPCKIPTVGVAEPCAAPGDMHSNCEVLGRKETPVIESITHGKEDSSIDGSKQDAQVQQLEALVAQNKAIASSVSELKSLSKASESNRESAFIKIMEENVRVMQNVGEKLASAGLSLSSTELDGRLPKLSRTNQELKTTIQQQQKRIETLINQNTSLEKKLQLAQHENKDGQAEDDVRRDGRAEDDVRRSSGSDSPQIPNNDTLSTVETKGKKGEEVSEEVLSDTSMDSLSSEKQKDFMETSGVSVIEIKQSLKPVSRGQALSAVQAGESRAGSLSPDQTSRGRSQQDSYHHSGSSEFSRRESPESRNTLAKEMRKGSSAVLDAETQKLLNTALRKEKETRTHLLEEAEREKEALQERIVTLVRENDCLAARLQEVVNVSRNLSGHVHSVKDQLVRVEAEKDDLHRKVRSLEDGREDSSLSLSDSAGSSRLTQRLKERIRNLQGEVEQGLQEAHQRTVERDKAVAEKESLEYTSSIAINTARKEAESLREQLASLQEERDRRSLEQANLQNELERKSVMAKAVQESQASHLERLVEAERRTEMLERDLKRLEEQLAKETLAKRSVEAELEDVRAKSVSSPHAGEGERTTSSGEQHWTSTVAHLRSQLQQEQLRVRLLEAGEQENSARALTLQRDVRDALEANRQLQDKYNQLRAAYKAKRAERSSQRELSQLYTAQVKELGKTSAALEENLKAMLCALGESIEVTVELLASHVFLTPCLVHPGPALHQNPETWFGAQQGRLRWLQDQLRKLCLHNWKTGNLPRTSNLDSSYFDAPFKESQSFLIAGKPQIEEEVEQRKRQVPRPSRMQQSGIKGDILSELSILESRSYNSTPERRRLSASDLSISTASLPTKFDGEAKHMTGEAKHMTPKPLPQIGETKIGMTPLCSTSVSGLHSQAAHSSVAHQGSAYMSEAERILMSQQKELSAAKYRQYKALIHSLQQDVDQSMAPSPSIPSSVFTTPERKGLKLSQDSMEENDNDSLSSDVSLTEIHCSQAVSPASASPSLSESSTLEHSLSGNSVKNMLHTPKETQGSQSHEEKMNPEYTASPETEDNSPKFPEQENTLNIKQTSRSSSRCSHVKSPTEDGGGGVREKGVQQVMGSLKEDQQIHGLDVDKDRDSWEQEPEEDLIRTLVYSEPAGS